MRTKFNPDKTVTYWSVYHQQWLTSRTIPTREVAAMGPEERELVRPYLDVEGHEVES